MDSELVETILFGIDNLKSLLLALVFIFVIRSTKSNNYELLLEKRARFFLKLALASFIIEKSFDVYELFYELEQLEILKDVAELASLVLVVLGLVLWDRARIRRIEFFKESANIDNLTKLNNYGFFKKAAQRRFAMAKEYSQSAAVVFIDVDHFKPYNDQYGHEAGNYALREVANTLRDALRADDLVARYGGEEFIAFLVAHSKELVGVVERLRIAILNHCNPMASKLIKRQITVSIGVAQIDGHHQNLDDLIEAADLQMYKAKENGRDQISVA
jgi:diguanylate cyclase (GGDEF)-like protein